MHWQGIYKARNSLEKGRRDVEERERERERERKGELKLIVERSILSFNELIILGLA